MNEDFNQKIFTVCPANIICLLIGEMPLEKNLLIKIVKNVEGYPKIFFLYRHHLIYFQGWGLHRGVVQ